MITDRYYFTRLGTKEKNLYRQLYDGVTAFQQRIPLNADAADQELISKVYLGMIADHPQMYFFRHTGYQLQFSGRQLTFIADYTVTKEEMLLYNRRMAAMMQEMFSRLQVSSQNVRETILSIHDELVRTLSYDHDAPGCRQDSGQFVRAHSIIGPFSRKSAVCDGISALTKLLLNQLDIPCIVVYGKGISNLEAAHDTGNDPNHGMGDDTGNDEDHHLDHDNSGHAWNMVKIGPHACHLDVTWDMAGTADDGQICHDYYCLPDGAIAIDHSGFHDVPRADTWEENYHYRKGLLFANEREVSAYAEHIARLGETGLDYRIRRKVQNMEETAAHIARGMAEAYARYSHRAVTCTWRYSSAMQTGSVTLS